MENILIPDIQSNDNLLSHYPLNIIAILIVKLYVHVHVYLIDQCASRNVKNNRFRQDCVEVINSLVDTFGFNMCFSSGGFSFDFSFLLNIFNLPHFKIYLMWGVKLQTSQS